ncbi:MAG TPA: hypothetical protein VFZ83_01855 [Acidimicrobiia bacterium]|nr:hypothetical protein [Acidimicrobiia bacterium]
MSAETLVGFGSAAITPALPIQLAGFIEDQPAATVHDDLEVHAFVVRDDAVTLCLLVFDLLGMSRDAADPIREAVAQTLGTGHEHVLTACVHTHAGPSVIAGSDRLGWVTPTGYPALLVERAVAAARAAHERAVAARLSFGRWPLLDGVSINRRGWDYSPTFAALDVHARDSGARLGTLANLAIHPVVLGPECVAVSSDWVGPFRRALEARVGGHTVLLSGAIGDVNPRHVHRQHNDCTDDPFAEAAQLADELASMTAGALPDAHELAPARPTVARHRTIDVPLGATMLATARGGASVSVELVEWTIGSVRIVSVPGEAFHALGRAVEARVTAAGEHALLAGLAPEWHGYLPQPFTDGYEEEMSYGAEAVAAIAAALTDPV